MDSIEFLRKHNEIIRSALNDYMRWYEAEEDMVPLKIQNCLTDLDRCLNDLNEFAEVCAVSKADIVDRVSDNAELLDRVNNMTYEDLRRISDLMAKGLASSDSYVIALDEAVEVWKNE